MKKIISFLLLMSLSFLFSCNSSDDGEEALPPGAPINLRGGLVGDEIKLSWEAPKYIYKLEYEIFFKGEGDDDFQLIATTTETNYIISSPVVGSNIFRVRSRSLGNVGLCSGFFDEAYVFVEGKFHLGEIQALYSIMKKNTNSGLCWEFDFDAEDSDNPINIRNYAETVRFSTIGGKQRVTWLDLSSKNQNYLHFSDLSDLSKLTALTTLLCSSTQLDSLDISRNMMLRTLNCAGNRLTSLDVRSNKALRVLACEDNRLTSLDVSNNTALTELFCGNNLLNSLNVKNNAALIFLFCYNNQLISLDVSNNTALTGLLCNDNQLTSLILSNNTALITLLCNNNQLSLLDVSNNIALTGLSCSNNRLTSLDLTRNPALKGLTCVDNLFQNGKVSILKSFIDKSQSIDGSKDGYLLPSKDSSIYEIVNNDNL